jgi:murein DD-endopeptidase MepM/ murein hydrolase activator NlpD
MVACALLCIPAISFAQTVQELQQQIAEHNAQIAELNKEIAQYQKDLDVVSSKKVTLQSTLSQLALSLKKTEASIKVTQNQIGSIQLQIKQLNGDINSTQNSIEDHQDSLVQSIRVLHDMDDEPLAVQMLSSNNISDAWEDIDVNNSVQSAVNDRINTLSVEKKSLSDTKSQQEAKQKELQQKQSTLLAQQGSLNATKKAQSDLLAVTKSQESTYQSIIAKKKAQEASFEAALTDLSAKLQYAVNPSQITPSGAGILRWPLDSVRVTQYFGNTPFAQSGAYAGKGHNGIDLGASIGTPIKAALTGIVIGTGNTDSVRGCYSFGKWVLIKHGNGLDTLYAHLSQIDVSSGQSVATGQVLGFSGETGYATGPHLHFGVYVSSATQVMRLGDATKSTTPCSTATMPVAPLSGYLNPLNYLPAQ